jgi:hypothetical protein
MGACDAKTSSSESIRADQPSSLGDMNLFWLKFINVVSLNNSKIFDPALNFRDESQRQLANDQNHVLFWSKEAWGVQLRFERLEIVGINIRFAFVSGRAAVPQLDGLSRRIPTVDDLIEHGVCDWFFWWIGNQNSFIKINEGALFNAGICNLLSQDFFLSVGVPSQESSQDCYGKSSGCRDRAIVAIKLGYEKPSWTPYKLPKRTINEPLSVLSSALIIVFGYFLLAWGGGSLLLWQNLLGRLASCVAIVLGIACVGHGLWNLIN